MKNRCGLRIELCVASDDLMDTADWFWLLKLAAWWAEPPEVRCSGRRGGCLLQAVCRSFLAHARQQKQTLPEFSEDVPMLMRANPEVQASGDAGIKPATETKPKGLDDRRCSAGSRDGSTEGGATEWANQNMRDHQQRWIWARTWFCWDVPEEDFIKKLSQITLNVN